MTPDNTQLTWLTLRNHPVYFHCSVLKMHHQAVQNCDPVVLIINPLLHFVSFSQQTSYGYNTQEMLMKAHHKSFIPLSLEQVCCRHIKMYQLYWKITTKWSFFNMIKNILCTNSILLSSYLDQKLLPTVFWINLNDIMWHNFPIHFLWGQVLLLILCMLYVCLSTCMSFTTHTPATPRVMWRCDLGLISF